MSDLDADPAIVRRMLPSVRLAAAAILLSGTATACAAKSAPPHQYQCANGKSFRTTMQGKKAIHVRTGARDYLLTRRNSSLGQKYGSDEGVLILDGDFAAFVLNSDTSFAQCVKQGD